MTTAAALAALQSPIHGKLRTKQHKLHNIFYEESLK